MHLANGDVYDPRSGEHIGDIYDEFPSGNGG